MVSHEKYCDLDFAKVDIDRKRRRGYAEAIYCPGKNKEHIKKISKEILKRNQDLLLTRLDKVTYSYLKKSFPKLQYHPQAKLAYIKFKTRFLKNGVIAVVSAGTSDIPVAEEAALTAEIMGNRVKRMYDVGVAGVHRIMDNLHVLNNANVIIVVAGMEGALASLVSGLVKCPVVAVPTSCGYGASFAGLSALLAMLNSCSPGVSVMNIDNGYGAGYFASLINR